MLKKVEPVINESSFLESISTAAYPLRGVMRVKRSFAEHLFNFFVSSLSTRVVGRVSRREHEDEKERLLLCQEYLLAMRQSFIFALQ